MDPISIGLWVELAAKLSGIVGGIVANLRSHGVSEEVLAGITADYDQRIARREGEAQP
jgi:hypothetical protein